MELVRVEVPGEFNNQLYLKLCSTLVSILLSMLALANEKCSHNSGRCHSGVKVGFRMFVNLFLEGWH